MKVINAIFRCCLPFFYLLYFFVSCNFPSSSPTVTESFKPAEYPVGYISQNINITLSDSTNLYPLQEEFLKSFMQMCTQYDGTHPTVSADFPDQWGVVLIERLPEGRELYQIQSQNREWVFLVITSGYGTQRILGILPVALNLANQTQDILETEIWSMERESDTIFSVTKKYEWVRSVEKITQKEYDANPQEYFRSKTITDKYTISNYGRFIKIETEDTPDYSAVIFYYKDEKPEGWEENIPLLQAFCEDYSILFAEVNKNFNEVPLYDYKLNFITELDLTPYMNFSEGIIFIKKDEKPKIVPFGSFERMKIEVQRYFKIIEI